MDAYYKTLFPGTTKKFKKMRVFFFISLKSIQHICSKSSEIARTRIKVGLISFSVYVNQLSLNNVK